LIDGGQRTGSVLEDDRQSFQLLEQVRVNVQQLVRMFHRMNKDLCGIFVCVSGLPSGLFAFAIE